MSAESFTWRGEPIPDIAAWAAARGERLVPYRAERRVPNILTGQLDLEVMTGTMPESFWHTLRQTDGWHYTEVPPA